MHSKWYSWSRKLANCHLGSSHLKLLPSPKREHRPPECITRFFTDTSRSLYSVPTRTESEGGDQFYGEYRGIAPATACRTHSKLWSSAVLKSASSEVTRAYTQVGLLPLSLDSFVLTPHSLSSSRPRSRTTQGEPQRLNLSLKALSKR